MHSSAFTSQRFLETPNKQREKEKAPSPSNSWVLCPTLSPSQKCVHRCMFVCRRVCGNPPVKKCVLCVLFPHRPLVSSSSTGSNSSPPVLGLWWSHSSDGWELHPLHQSPWWVKFSIEVIGLASAFLVHWLDAVLCQVWLVLKNENKPGISPKRFG